MFAAHRRFLYRIPYLPVLLATSFQHLFDIFCQVDFLPAEGKVWTAVVIIIVSAGIIAVPYLFPKDPDRAFLNRAQTGWSYTRGYFAGMGWAKADIEEDRRITLNFP